MVYKIFGQVGHNKNNKISLKFHHQLEIKGAKGTHIIADIKIHESEIVIVITPKNKILDYDQLRHLLTNTINSFLDCYGYIHGIALDVELTHIEIDDQIQYFDIGIDILKKDVCNRPVSNYNDIFPLIQKSDLSQLRIALADLRRSIKYPLDMPLYTYRAVESLMQYFKKNKDEKSKKGWEKLRNNLNITKDYIDLITNYSVKIRHGEQISISNSDANKLRLRTWKIVDRFILFVINDNKKLDESQYPFL